MITIKNAIISATITVSTILASHVGNTAPVDGDDWLHTQGNQIVDKDGMQFG